MEGVPNEKETIAVKRSIRLKQKLREAKTAFMSRREWWSDGPVEFSGIFIIVLINFLVLIPFFGSMAHEITFSGPIIPILGKLFSLFGFPLSYSIQMINLIFILAFPISFYFFVKVVSKRKFSAFISTLIVSLPVHPFLSSRIDNGLIGSEGSFISSLPAVFLSLVMLLNFLRLGGAKNLTFVSISASVTAMISPFGFFCFVILAIITTFSEILLGEGRLKLFRLLTSLVFAGMISSFWYNPAFLYWLVMGEMGQDVREMIKNLIPISFFVIPVLATIGYLLFDRKPNLQPLFLATFYTIIFAIFTLTGEGLVPGNPGRYIHLFGISIGFIIGIGSLNLIEHYLSTGKIKNALLASICVCLIGFSVIYQSIFSLNKSGVLGVWTDVNKGSIWLAKDEFGNRFSVFGYLISIAGIGGLTYLSKSSKMPQ